MDVVKIGGSLVGHIREIMSVLVAYDVLVVPGGGEFADTVRRMQRRTGIEDATAHRMAIIAMDQYGLLLSDVSGISAYGSLSEVTTPGILLPYELLNANDPFTPSWDVTSDTISCHIAKLTDAKRFIIMTDVDGIFANGRLVDEISASKLQDLPETCVDLALPGYLLEYRMDCQIVNGKDKSAVGRVLNGEPSGTMVRGK